MSDFFLDLKDKPRVVDFLVEASIYADEKSREEAAEWAKKYHDGERVPTDKLAAAARKLAMATWPARYALHIFCTKEDPEEEWRRVNAAVRPSTAHLLKRLRSGVKAKTLDETLAHSEAVTAIGQEEQQEIAEVRTHVRHDIWKEKGSTLEIIMKAGKKEWEGYAKRFAMLRDLATTLPQSFQDEVFSKMARYEDRILFAVEILPMEILDEEVKYYNEQREFSPLEA
ncbi:MAG: hypothetical protein WC787_01945 [Patescibacteria group bacterium]|jgi:hypothetical protein